MNNPILIRVVVSLVLYFFLYYFGGSFGEMVLYPVTRLVTFLHEFGHALGALITGGSVLGIQINPDGSGYTKTLGGSASVILMGGYIGSALLGNLIFYIGARMERFASFTIYVIAGLMLFSGIFWFEAVYSTGFLIAFSIGLYLLVSYTNFAREILMFVGLAVILYIIQDFNVGPTSDLEKYAELFVIIPAGVWMYIWLGIVILLFIGNIRLIFKSN
ncbi:MAG: M50 family metallopeptidase [Saprospiraceae bacterium]